MSELDESSAETGRILRDEWLRQLAEIADIELQRRTWLDPAHANPHWTYIEFVESYPDAENIKDAEARGWLTPRTAEILLQFGKVLFAHEAPTGNDYDNAAVLDDPEWHKVVRAAHAALTDLRT